MASLSSRLSGGRGGRGDDGGIRRAPSSPSTLSNGCNGKWVGMVSGFGRSTVGRNEIQSQSPIYLRHISDISRPKLKRCEVEREGGGREGFGRIKDDVWGVMEARERISGGSGAMENQG